MSVRRSLSRKLDTLFDKTNRRWQWAVGKKEAA
jgi:hypothetical protein